MVRAAIVDRNGGAGVGDEGGALEDEEVVVDKRRGIQPSLREKSSMNRLKDEEEQDEVVV